MAHRKWSDNNTRQFASTIECDLQYVQALRELGEELQHDVQALLRASAEQRQWAKEVRETAVQLRRITSTALVKDGVGELPNNNVDKADGGLELGAEQEVRPNRKVGVLK